MQDSRFWKRRIIVTGSSGFIGRHLFRACKVHWPEHEIIGVDVANGNDCRKFFANDVRGADVIFHCAAITGGIEGTTGNPAPLAAINAQMDGAFFEWALRTRPNRIVYFSSSCAYPMMSDTSMRNKRLTRESDLNLGYVYGHPDNTYGWVKLLGEVIANSVREAGVPTTIVRPFAVYGSDQETCRMVPAFVERAIIEDGDTFDVWGEGDQASDFIHVTDTVNACIAAVDNAIDGPVNLGTGRGAPADEVAQLVMTAANVNRKIIHRTDKPTGPRWRVADPTLLHTFYKPKISLEDGVWQAVHAKTGIPTSYGPGDDLA